MIKQQHKGNIPFSIQYSNYIQMKFHYITNSNSKHAFAQQVNSTIKWNLQNGLVTTVNHVVMIFQMLYIQ
jgi:hypothetical protein